MPPKDRERISKALNDMRTNPLAGDTIPLRGEYQGQFRTDALSVPPSSYRRTPASGAERSGNQCGFTGTMAVRQRNHPHPQTASRFSKNANNPSFPSGVLKILHSVSIWFSTFRR